jgi:hypothetical protein
MKLYRKLSALSKTNLDSFLMLPVNTVFELFQYIPATEVIKRLNEAGAWNCRIVKEVINDDEVAVLIELEIDGSKRQQWGGKQRKGGFSKCSK